MKRGDKIRAALSAAGATLERAKKHLVYRLPNGATLTLSQTPSDHRAEQKQLRDVRHALGMVESGPKAQQPAREKREKPGRSETDTIRLRAVGGLAGGVHSSGLLELQQRAKITELERELHDARWRMFTAEDRAMVAERRVSQLEALRVVQLWYWLQAKLGNR